MEFLELLKESPRTMSREHHDELFKGGIFRMTYETSGYRDFYPLRINDNLFLSIQASFGHYSTPRLTIAKEKYKSMEMAVLFNQSLVNINEVVTLKDKELADNLSACYDEPIYSYVPVNVIEALYQELKQWEKENASK